MRNLTIKRTKSFIACLAKAKVYIEDPYSNDLVIDNVTYRKLGTLKNGEEKSFVIDENPRRIYVIFGKSSKNYCNDFCDIPAGREDVYLTGKNRYNPAAGNPFRFDGVETPEMYVNRVNSTNKGIVVLIIAVAIGIVVGNMLAFFILP